MKYVLVHLTYTWIGPAGEIRQDRFTDTAQNMADAIRFAQAVLDRDGATAHDIRFSCAWTEAPVIEVTKLDKKGWTLLPSPWKTGTIHGIEGLHGTITHRQYQLGLAIMVKDSKNGTNEELIVHYENFIPDPVQESNRKATPPAGDWVQGYRKGTRSHEIDPTTGKWIAVKVEQPKKTKKNLAEQQKAARAAMLAAIE